MHASLSPRVLRETLGKGTCLTHCHSFISSDAMKVLAMSRDIWVPRVYRFRNYLGQGCMSWISWLDMNSSVILRQWAALTLGGQSLRLVDGNILVPECRIPLNNVSCFLCNHYCGSIEVATDHAGHDGSIHDSEVFYPEDPGL